MDISDYMTTKQAKEFCGTPCVPYTAFGLDFPKPTKLGRQNLYLIADLAEWKQQLDAVRERRAQKERQHRRASVCAECGQPWPCDSAMPTEARCKAITANGERCRLQARGKYHSRHPEYCGQHQWLDS